MLPSDPGLGVGATGDKAPLAVLFPDTARPAHVLCASAVLSWPVLVHPSPETTLTAGGTRVTEEPGDLGSPACGSHCHGFGIGGRLLPMWTGCWGLDVLSDYLQIGSFTNLLPAHLWEWSTVQTHLSFLQGSPR